MSMSSFIQKIQEEDLQSVAEDLWSHSSSSLDQYDSLNPMELQLLMLTEQLCWGRPYDAYLLCESAARAWPHLARTFAQILERLAKRLKGSPFEAVIHGVEGEETHEGQEALTGTHPQLTALFLEKGFHPSLFNPKAQYCELIDERQQQIFLFPSCHDLFHALADSTTRETLLQAKALLCLDLYMLPQLQLQRELTGPFKLQTSSIEGVLQEQLSDCLELLHDCLRVPEDTPEHSSANALLALGKHHQRHQQLKRWGQRGKLACYTQWKIDDWHESYKGALPPHFTLKEPLPDVMGEALEQCSTLGARRCLKTQGKKRIAHVVSQVVEGGHAPTRLVKMLLEHHDKDHYDLFLYSTETLVRDDVPFPLGAYSDLSSQRAPQLLKELHAKGISISLGDGKKDFEELARNVAEWMLEDRIDVAFFHGDDATNLLTAQIAEVPFKVFFQQSVLPDYPIFDAFVVSDERQWEEKKELFEAAGVHPIIHTVVVNAKEGWTEQAPTKEALGVTADTKILTSISNHLETRVSPEMCAAIGEILQQHPNAVYMPIGELKDSTAFRERFALYGVMDRIKPLGVRKHPSNLLRNMDVYLNEFPFSGGMAVLDAMAAGCPVVTFFDAEGPAYKRAGAIYFGEEKALHSCKKEDYVELAGRLLKDEAMAQEWSQWAQQRYLLYSDAAQYTQVLENKIEEILLQKI